MKGPKQVVCSICKKSVLKAQTRHIGGSERACKIHDGVEAKAAASYQTSQQQLSATRKPPKKWTPADPQPVDVSPRCLACKKRTVHVSDVLMESLLVSKELEMDGQPGAILTAPEAVGDALREKFNGKISAYTYVIGKLPPDKWEQLARRIPSHLRSFVEHVGVVNVCLECVERFDLPNQLEENRPKMPSLETLALLGDIVDENLTKQVRQRKRERAENN